MGESVEHTWFFSALAEKSERHIPGLTLLYQPCGAPEAGGKARLRKLRHPPVPRL